MPTANNSTADRVTVWIPSQPGFAATIPLAQVHHLPSATHGTTRDATHDARGDVLGSLRPCIGVLCPSCDGRLRSAEDTRAAACRGASCPFVHASLSGATITRPHSRRVLWPSATDLSLFSNVSLSEVLTPTFQRCAGDQSAPPSELSCVRVTMYESKDERTIPLSQLYATRLPRNAVFPSPMHEGGADVTEPVVVSECFHFSKHDFCHRGSACRFAHLVTSTSGNCNNVSRTTPSPASDNDDDGRGVQSGLPTNEASTSGGSAGTTRSPKRAPFRHSPYTAKPLA